MDRSNNVLSLIKPKILSLITLDSIKDSLSSKDSLGKDPCISNSRTRELINHEPISLSTSGKDKNRHKKKGKSKSCRADSLSTLKSRFNISPITSPPFLCDSKDAKVKKSKLENRQSSGEFFKENKTIREIYISSDPVTVKELAIKLTVPSADIIKWLFLKGISVTINQLLDASTVELIAKHHSFNVLRYNNEIETPAIDLSKMQSGRSRSPIITLLGHVDHGKTTLLKAIKEDDCETQEAGNITQSIRSYEVFMRNSAGASKLIFLDTPGHAAFTGMRKRGANITDIVVLVVAADDGLQPQTVEAIEYIKSRNIPFVVAINKIDTLNADVVKVKDQLADFNIIDKSRDINNYIIGVSALRRKNIDHLLRAIDTISKSQNLKSDPSIAAEGSILDAYLNRKKGPIAQLLVKNGTLHVGDIILAGHFYGKVKAISGSINHKMKSIESAALADVLCFTKVPTAGLSFRVVADEKEAKNLASRYAKPANFTILDSRISLDDISQKNAKKIIKQVNLIIKTETQGAIDAIVHALSTLPQEKVQINLLFAASGEVSLKDIKLASTTSSLILAFALTVPSSTIHDAEKCGVSIFISSVIYDLVDHVKDYMLSFVGVDYEKEIIGYARVKSLFVVNKGIVAGCFIESGKLKKKSYFQIERAEDYFRAGLIDSLKIVKDDVDEIYAGNECGVMCKDYDSWEIGDLLQCYELKPLEKTL